MATILLLEDDQAFASVLSEFLSFYGHIVDIVEDFATAQDQMITKPYELVIVDLFLRVGDRYDPRGGIGLINWIRVQRWTAKPNIAEIPIIAVSGLGSETTAQFTLSSAKTSGADRVFPKPVPPEDLMEAIDTLTDEGFSRVIPA